METNHDCSQVIDKVFLALDGELTQNEEKGFMQEIQTCSKCLERYEIEKSFKIFLTNKIARKNVAPNLANSIRDKIKALAIGKSL